jgi:hypothetical protein
MLQEGLLLRTLRWMNKPCSVILDWLAMLGSLLLNIVTE